MPEFDPRGRELFDSLHDSADPASLTALVVEAARIVDRLDRLDALLSGDIECWARLVEARDEVVEVRVDSALQEARQQANVLRQLLVEINRRKSPAGSGDDDDLDGIS
ncbi:hypothetical protein [Nocardia cyriacigeorgica]|uniref:hypothetical protein n=1 Tax=Nocardia cyriacigeorgica TaxID=135487 RepID=UPI0018949B2D|nr:hypothetical protein [Nocardia cyriacigeorgica]MBF6289307.1 hypothetical protein [Nocardia cyriacigeorgica]